MTTNQSIRVRADEVQPGDTASVDGTVGEVVRVSVYSTGVVIEIELVGKLFSSFFHHSTPMWVER